VLPIRRSRRLAAVAGLAVLVLSGCGDAAMRSASAAMVGDTSITTDTLSGLVERGLSDPQAAQQLGADRDTYQRQVLARLINSEVLDEAAKRAGVEVTPGEVDQQIAEFAEQAGGREALEQQAAQSGISPTDLPDFVRDIVVEQALGDELTKDVDVPREALQAAYDQNIAQYDQVRSRHILVPNEQQARDILAQVRADESRFAPLAAEFSTDTSNKDAGGDLGLVGKGAFVPEFEQLLFSAEPGTYDVVQTQFGWHVVNVLERVTTPLSEAEPELRRTALQDERTARTQELLRTTAAQLDITVNSRFGTWNPETGTVEPDPVPNGVSSPAPGDAPGEDQHSPGESHSESSPAQ
jgi:foldase protein PrsA